MLDGKHYCRCDATFVVSQEDFALAEASVQAGIDAFDRFLRRERAANKILPLKWPPHHYVCSEPYCLFPNPCPPQGGEYPCDGTDCPGLVFITVRQAAIAAAARLQDLDRVHVGIKRDAYGRPRIGTRSVTASEVEDVRDSNVGPVRRRHSLRRARVAEYAAHHSHHVGRARAQCDARQYYTRAAIGLDPVPAVPGQLRLRRKRAQEQLRAPKVMYEIQGAGGDYRHVKIREWAVMNPPATR
ncbi:hypothetical protein FISHEDRAFT_74382 [Fistulina hepatica ATCC 64428]|uniref:Uncharacterized protein n=1 Tax=Fistulina hepatica ATCC 64428 TaxID=1128425 RepID=A0A0D7ACQ1_9AGAR|nr:hypothetical protein FISHEDRAFT_74382 [Fistulina hepatica ATCC 64428]